MVKRLYIWCKDNWLAIVSCTIIVVVATIAIAANIVIKYTGENPVACLWDEAKIKKRRKSRFIIHEKFSCTDISYL